MPKGILSASTFQEVFKRRSIEFLRLASASGISFFSTHFYLVFLKIAAQRVVRLPVSVLHDRYSHAGNYIGLPSNIALFLLSTPLKSPATPDNCTCFDFLMSGIKISLTKFLIYISFDHGFQSLIIGH